MMSHEPFVLFITFYLVLTIDLELAASDNETASTTIPSPTSEDQTSSDDYNSLLNNVMNEANSSNASQSLLELVELAKNSTDNDTNEHENKTMPNRRFLSWFKEVISNYTTPKPFYTTSNLFYTRPSLIYSTPSPMYGETSKNNSYDERFLQSYLISVLKNLTQVLEKLNRNIEEQISLNPLIVQPLIPNRDVKRRSKREAPKVFVNETLGTTNATNFTVSTTTTPLRAITLTPAPNPSSTSQDGLEIEPKVYASTQNESRRSMRNSNSAIKEKLLNYINDTFQEIETKILPVQEIKRAYASEEFFRIGYIVANIDTLEVSIKNLREDMEVRSSQWEDKKVLDLFDKIMVTNKVVTNLIESLNELQSQKNVGRVHKLH